MFQPTQKPSSAVLISKKLNIVCVWRMLRSHHRAYKLYMRTKLSMSRYAGGRALLYGTLAVVISFGLYRCWRWVEGSGWRLAGFYASLCGKDQMINTIKKQKRSLLYTDLRKLYTNVPKLHRVSKTQ